MSMKVPRKSQTRYWKIGLFVVLASAGIVALIFSWMTPTAKWKERAIEQGAPKMVGVMLDSPMSMPAVRAPRFYDVDSAELSDTTAVIGIRVGEQCRAYCVKAMTGVGEQVVNDYFDDRAITIVRSNRTKIVRVLTDPNASGPLNIRMHSWMKGELNFRYGSNHYALTDRNVPLEDWKFEETTWKEWKTRNPSTLVYVEAPDFANLGAGRDRRLRPGSPVNWPIRGHETTLPSESKLLFRFKHPAGWKIVLIEQGLRIEVPRAEGESTAFVDIQAHELGEDSVPQEFLDTSYNSAKLNGERAEFEMKVSEALNVGDFPARRIYATWTAEQVDRGELLYVIWTDQAGLVVRCHGPLTEIEKWRSAADAIGRSIQLPGETSPPPEK